MYLIHRTPGLILKSIPTGEASRYFFIFTKEFGRIGAHAQGVREFKSKLRYHLEDYSYTEIEVVRGTRGFRITNAKNSTQYAGMLIRNGEFKKSEAVVKIIRLLERLLHGEESNKALFSEVTEGFSLLAENKIPEMYIESFEIILVMRILFHLGYWGNDQIFESFLKENLAHAALLQEVGLVRTRAVREINRALRETQL